jgi:hypothetical protein
VTADGGSVLQPPLNSSGPSQLHLLDIPLLRDQDDTGQNGSRGYWAANNYGGSTWPGAKLYRSADGSSWSEVGRAVTGAPWGVSNTALGDPASPWRLDTVNTVDIAIVEGEDQLASCTELELVNGANAAALIKSNGEVEIIQFQTVTSLGNQEYRLSNLLRGRRGSDTMAYSHAANEVFVLLTTSTVNALTTTVALLDTTFRYRAVTAGQLPEAALIETFEFSGRDLMPYAPMNHTCVDSGTDTIISWVRRTRLGGGLADGTGDVPLAEGSEEYELEILDGPAGSVVRTVTALSSPTYTYSDANRSADGLGSATALTLKVYQMSELVGRGFTREVTVPIT